MGRYSPYSECVPLGGFIAPLGGEGEGYHCSIVSYLFEPSAPRTDERHLASVQQYGDGSGNRGPEVGV